MIQWNETFICPACREHNWLHFFFTWLFLYHKEVSRVFSSTSNIAWQFSYQWHRQCAILLQTQIHMYANLVEQNLILTLSWSLCLYFFKSCFLLGAVSEKYSYISLATFLLLNFRVAKNFFNNFFMTWAQKEFAYVICCRIQQKIHETHKICLWLERIRSWHNDLPICYTIQQKIHETHKIWHPSEQNYFVHFNKR